MINEIDSEQKVIFTTADEEGGRSHEFIYFKINI